MVNKKMQLFQDFKSKTGREIAPEELHRMITGDEKLKADTLLHRQLLCSGQTDAATRVKEGTPQVAVSFRMEGGKSLADCRECLYLLLIDFDAKGPKEQLSREERERVYTVLRTSYHAMVGYESISGMGYHIIVPFRLPEGVTIDMEHDPKRGAEIFRRVHRFVNNIYSVYCRHPMDAGVGNPNRMTGLSHDPLAVYREDARPFYPTCKELGIDANGNLVRMRSSRTSVDKDGNRVAVPLGDCLDHAVKMVEEAGVPFTPGQRHDHVMRVSFLLNLMGVDEQEAADALDALYGPLTDETPSKVLHSCYRTASSEFGTWMKARTKADIKAEVIARFLHDKPLRYDIITHKVQINKGQWHEMTERDMNDLLYDCCICCKDNISPQLFRCMMNSSAIPTVNPLREYLESLPAWNPEMTDYIAQVAGMVRTREDSLWPLCFRKWFVAMIAAWMDDEVVNHQVLVLIGEQGIYKTSWLDALMPPELAAYRSKQTAMERLDKDEQLRSVEYGLINFDEIDKLSERGLNELKSIITNSHVDVRPAYGAFKEKRVRIASYVASGNKDRFLTDMTGNRRWLPFHVEHIDSPFEHPLPYRGLYAQALYLLKDGYRYWFDLEDIRMMAEHVDEFMIETNEEQLVPMHFDPAAPGTPGAEFLTLAEISAKLIQWGNIRNPMDLRRLGLVMTKLGYTSIRKGHNGTRGYVLREKSQMDIERMHATTLNADIADMLTSNSQTIS